MSDTTGRPGHVQTIVHGDTSMYYYRDCSCGWQGPPRHTISEAIEDTCAMPKDELDDLRTKLAAAEQRVAELMRGHEMAKAICQSMLLEIKAAREYAKPGGQKVSRPPRLYLLVMNQPGAAQHVERAMRDALEALATGPGPAKA